MFWSEKKLSENTYGYLKPYLSPNDAVLDVGSGNGLVAELIQSNGSKVSCTDVIDICITEKKPTIFDGVNLPYKDQSFSVVICSFVLHHTPKQIELINELKRVSQSKIIIFEDLNNNLIDHFFTSRHKKCSVKRYKTPNMIFRSDKEWKDLFIEMELKLIAEEKISRIRDLIYPVTRRMYVLTH